MAKLLPMGGTAKRLGIVTLPIVSGENMALYFIVVPSPYHLFSKKFFFYFFVRHILARIQFKRRHALPQQHADTADSSFTSCLLCFFD